MLEVIRKQHDCALARAVKQVVADFTLHGGGNQALVTVGHGGCHVFLCRALPRFYHQVEQVIQHNIRGHGQRNFEKALFLAPVDGKHAVPGDLIDPLTVIIVLRVDRILVLCLFGFHTPVAEGEGPHGFAIFRIVGYILGDDIHRPGKRFLCRFHAFFFINVGCRLLVQRGGIGFFLCQEQFGKRGKPLFSCHRCACFAVRAEGAVNIVHLRDGGGGVNGSGNFVGQFFLRGNQPLDLLFARLDIAQIFQPLLQFAKHRVVQRPGDLLAVTGDKRDGVSLINQRHGLFDLFFGDSEFRSEFLHHVHGVNSFPVLKSVMVFRL